MKTIGVLILFFAVCAAHNHSIPDGCHRPCPDLEDYATTSEQAIAWICEVKTWRCAWGKWFREIKSSWDTCAVELGLDRLEEAACPDQEMFACCTGTQECEFVDNCTICHCNNGRFRDYTKITRFWTAQIKYYRRVFDTYMNLKAQCTGRSDECDVDSTGQGGTGAPGTNMTQPTVNGTAPPMMNMTHTPPMVNGTAPPMGNMTHPPTMVNGTGPPMGNMTHPPTMTPTPGPTGTSPPTMAPTPGPTGK